MFETVLELKLKDYPKVNKVLTDLETAGALDNKKWRSVGLYMTITLCLQELRMLRNALMHKAIDRSNGLTIEDRATYRRLADIVLYD